MITIDEHSLKEFGLFALQGHEHPLTPEYDKRTLYIPGRAGVYDFGAVPREKRFTIPIGIIEYDKLIKQQKLRDFMNILFDEYGRPKEVKMTFDYDPDKFYKVKVNERVEFERLVHAGQLEIEFAAFDPFAYSIEETTLSELTTTNKVLTDLGDMVSYPIIELTSLPGQVQAIDMGGEEEGNELGNLPLSNPKITVGGKTLTYSGDITDTLTIDFAKYIAKHGSANAMPNLSGEWGDLKPGNNTISITDDNNSEGLIKITHRGRWL